MQKIFSTCKDSKIFANKVLKKRQKSHGVDIFFLQRVIFVADLVKKCDSFCRLK